MPKSWKINSIGFGSRLLTLIVVLTGAIPLGLYLLHGSLSRHGTAPAWILKAASVSFIVGLCSLGGFILLLLIEFSQDHYLYRRYLKNRHQKLQISTDQFECQYCGNRMVRESDHVCSVCGKSIH